MSDAITVPNAALSAGPRAGLARSRVLLLAGLLFPLACDRAEDPAGPPFAGPTVTTTSLADARQNVAYSQTLVAVGGPNRRG